MGGQGEGEGSLISSLANSFISNWYDNSLGYAVSAAWGKVVELCPTLLGSVGKCVDSSGPDGINEPRNDVATHKFEGCFLGGGLYTLMLCFFFQLK